MGAPTHHFVMYVDVGSPFEAGGEHEQPLTFALALTPQGAPPSLLALHRMEAMVP